MSKEKSSFNKTFYFNKDIQKPRWIVIDAKGRVLGRLATQVASTLRGKHVPWYTPHADAGDYVVIINAKDIVLTGDKWDSKIYDRYTGWIGGYKTRSAREMQEKHPTKIIELAVKRMLPKTKLGKTLFNKLRVYTGPEHPHQAQVR